jgi:hypothetical protein
MNLFLVATALLFSEADVRARQEILSLERFDKDYPTALPWPVTFQHPNRGPVFNIKVTFVSFFWQL